MASVLGVGGGFVNVPTLSILFSLDAATAIGTSLAVIFITAFSGTIGYARQKRIFFRSAILLAIPALTGAALGSGATAFVPQAALFMIFGCILLLIGLRLIFPWIPFIHHIPAGPSYPEQCHDCFGQCITMQTYPVHLVIWGFTSGVLGGMTGMGGGIIIVPALLASGMPIHFAVATSTLVITVSSGSAAVVHAGLGHISPFLAAVYAAGGFIGAQIGSRVAPRIQAAHLHTLLASMYLVLSCIMLAKAVSTW
jgi:uncharacterized membrane protein YfcA